MDIIYLQNLIESYSLSTLVIAVISFAVLKISEAVFGEKLPEKLKAYLPIITAIALEFLYTGITEKFSISAEIISNGIIGGSLSLLANGIIKGKTQSIEQIAISELLLGTVSIDKIDLVTKEIVKILKADSSDVEGVKKVISEYANISEKETERLTKIVCQTIDALTNPKGKSE